MQANALPQTIYDEAKKLGIEKIQLHFSGGNDEGNLNVTLLPFSSKNDALEQRVCDWAWESYSYSGAGDGTDYGDDIEYDLTNKTVTTGEWCMVRENQGEQNTPFEIEAEAEAEAEAE